MSGRTPAQIGAANRARGKDTERKVAAYLAEHGLGNGRRNLAGYARDHGDIGPVLDRDGDAWCVEVKGPGHQPLPGEVEAWALEAEREAENAGVPCWLLVVRRAMLADVGRWWAYVDVGTLCDIIGGADLFRCEPSADHGPARIDLRTWVALVAPESPTGAA
jgi:hypothetical protein